MTERLKKWLQLKALEQEINQELEQALSQGRHTIQLNEFYVLHFLSESRQKSLRISDISQHLGLSLSATSRMLVKFETTCKVIERSSCPDDKRGIEIHLTSQGKKVLEDSYRLLEPVLKRYQIDKIIK